MMRSGHAKLIFLLLVTTLFTFTQVGCASRKFSRGDIQEQVAIGKLQYDDKAIQAEFNKKPNLRRPFKVGVYFKSPKDSNGKTKTWKWTEQDRDFLKDLGQDLKAKGVVADIFLLTSSLVEDEDLRSLRLVAARHHADVLLVVSGAGDVERALNKWGWTYALLLPTLFAPGSDSETLFVTNATLWDVRNEYLYASAEAESNKKDRYIAAFRTTDKTLLEAAKEDSLRQLNNELRKVLGGTKL